MNLIWFLEALNDFKKYEFLKIELRETSKGFLDFYITAAWGDINELVSQFNISLISHVTMVFLFLT